MGLKEIYSYIAKHEKGKEEISIGNIREVVKLISDLIVEDEAALKSLVSNGRRRLKSKSKKTKRTRKK